MSEQQSQRGKQWLSKFLQLMGIPAGVKIGEANSNSAEDNAQWLIIDEMNLTPEQIDILIGKEGETIDAIQYLANSLLNIGIEVEEKTYFTLELNGYRVRRQAELLALAQKAAEEVRSTGKEVALRSLSSAERRQIHSFLQDSQDLQTESRGQEPDRRLIVRLG